MLILQLDFWYRLEKGNSTYIGRAQTFIIETFFLEFSDQNL